MLKIKTLLVTLLLATLAFGLAQTTVPGHQDKDGTVTGVYEFTSGDWHYVVHYRGDFGDDPYLDDGWIKNKITHIPTGAIWHFTIVHETDSRYTGEGIAIWNTWEYFMWTQSNQGDPVDNGVISLSQPSAHN